MRLAKPVAICVILSVLGACNANDDTTDKPTSAPAPAKAEAPQQLTGPVPMPYEEPVVGGAVMAAGKDLMANIARSQDHTILLRTLGATGLDEVLRGPGPFTLFAPTNAAFERMPAGSLEDLMKPENRDELTDLLSYHLVPGRLDADALEDLLLKGNGSTVLNTVEGSPLKAIVGDGKARMVDARGNLAEVSVANVLQSNGVMHVVNSVLMPSTNSSASR